MWLINTQTLKLEFFSICPEGQYAILSHVWQDGEISFSEFQAWDGAKTERVGLIKILRCCEKAYEMGLVYAWVDTCCIDKSSSAELSEAINSMFQWYAKAGICFAYLYDVDCEPIRSTRVSYSPARSAHQRRALRLSGPTSPRVPNFARSVYNTRKKKRTAVGTGRHDHQNFSSLLPPVFGQSRWFTRGWTLQELVAPRKVLFFTSKWVLICSKSSISGNLQDITGIDEDIILLAGNIADLPIARKMSWVSSRTTTRAEDMAYCLLGIFNVNLPLLYGEGGERAFARLQQAILSATDDETIFAWSLGPGKGSVGVLAPFPAAFRGFESAVPLSMSYDRPAYSMTNKGLSIDASLWLIGPEIYLMPLLCDFHHPSTQTKTRLALILRRVKKDTYARVHISTNILGCFDGSSSDVALLTEWSDKNFGMGSWPPRPVRQKLCIGALNLVVLESPHDSLAHTAQIYIIQGSLSDFADERPLTIECHYYSNDYMNTQCLYFGSKVSTPFQDDWQDASQTSRREIAALDYGLDIRYNNTHGATNAFGRVRIGFDFDLNPVCMFPASARKMLDWSPPSLLSLRRRGKDESQWLVPARLDDSTYCLRGDRYTGLDARFAMRLISREQNTTRVSIFFCPSLESDRLWVFRYEEGSATSEDNIESLPVLII